MYACVRPHTGVMVEAGLAKRRKVLWFVKPLEPPGAVQPRARLGSLAMAASGPGTALDWMVTSAGFLDSVPTSLVTTSAWKPVSSAKYVTVLEVPSGCVRVYLPVTLPLPSPLSSWEWLPSSSWERYW
ncbi:unnamed protein product [Ixodes pacificus]